MPLIEVKMIEEVFTPAQKKELIAKLTDAVVALEGEALRPYTVLLTAVVAVEKLAPSSRWPRFAVGLALTAWGIGVMVQLLST